MKLKVMILSSIILLNFCVTAPSTSSSDNALFTEYCGDGKLFSASSEFCGFIKEKTLVSLEDAKIQHACLKNDGDFKILSYKDEDNYKKGYSESQDNCKSYLYQVIMDPSFAKEGSTIKRYLAKGGTDTLNNPVNIKVVTSFNNSPPNNNLGANNYSFFSFGENEEYIVLAPPILP